MEGFAEGYSFFQQNVGNIFGMASGDQYITDVEDAISELADTLNKQFAGSKADIKQLKGNVAEFWHAGTHNINAVVKGSKIKAEAFAENGYASVDVGTTDGGQYGLKYYRDAAETMKQQAKTARETFSEYQANGGKQSFEEYMKARNVVDPDAPIYAAQTRIVPKEQLEEIRKLLRQKIATEESIRPEQVERYRNTLEMLDDRIRDSEGVESVPLDTEDAKKLARLAKESGVTDEELQKMGLSTEELVGFGDVMHQAFKAGLTAATISMVLKLAPEIYKSIELLIQNGVLDSDDFARMGFAALDGASEGFVRGTVAAALTAACQSGMWGAALKSIDPTIIGAVTVITMNTMKNAFGVVQGRMSQRELANELVHDMFMTTCSLAAGAVGQALIEIPVLGFMIGSFVGSMVGSFAYDLGYNAILSFCVDTGFTMFGLVDQNYEVPDEVMREVGFDVFKFEEFTYEEFSPEEFAPQEFSFEEFNPAGLSITVLRRGVIGVSQIGYV